MSNDGLKCSECRPISEAGQVRRAAIVCWTLGTGYVVGLRCRLADTRPRLTPGACCTMSRPNRGTDTIFVLRTSVAVGGGMLFAEQIE